MSAKTNRQDVEKQNRWRGIIREATRSDLSIREFCRRGKIKESQYYWWQRKLFGEAPRRDLKERTRGERHRSAPAAEAHGSFSLVSEEEEGALEAGIELVLGNGRRLRIGKRVDEQTLRTVLAAMGAPRC